MCVHLTKIDISEIKIGQELVLLPVRIRAQFPPSHTVFILIHFESRSTAILGKM